MSDVSPNQNELEALRILWERGPSKPAEVQDQFSWEIENATLRSVLLNLVEKGCVTRKLRGKAFYYAARVPKQSLLKSMIQTLARVFAGGSHQELVVQLVKTGDLKADDLKVISQIAAGQVQSKRKRRTNESD